MRHRIQKEESAPLNSLKERVTTEAEPTEGTFPFSPREQWVERLRSAFEPENAKGVAPRFFRSSAT
jgi:hypothetical protein